MTEIFATCIFIFLTQLSQSRVYDRCALAREFYYVHGIEHKEIPNWLCLIDKQVAYNTSVVVVARDGSGNHGLFQFNDRWWCMDTSSDKEPGANICKVPCSAMTDDNISDDVRCAVRHFSEHPINNTEIYVKYCKDRDLNVYIDGCHM